VHAIKDKRVRVYQGMRFELSGVKAPTKCVFPDSVPCVQSLDELVECLTSRQLVSGRVRP